jgi:hypothetical protein
MLDQVTANGGGMDTSKSNCRQCACTTNHEILHQTIQQGNSDFYEERDTWQVLKCLGCGTLGFRHIYEDFERMVETPDGERPSTTSRRYPYAVAGHKVLNHLYLVPHLISKVYRQSVAAYAGEASIVASMGLRATIEAVCNHLAISGSSLQKRIDSLFKGGHISSADKKRLHAIRFLGNDSAHEIRQPKATELAVALEIVEHLVKSVFILEKRAQGLLDTTIETFEDFLPMLEQCTKNIDPKTSHSLTGILGKNLRRLATELPALEAELITRIGAGQIGFLTVDSVQEIDHKSVQFYKRVEVWDDDIPF